jgi:RND family efflux transporter MFP subunit
MILIEDTAMKVRPNFVSHTFRRALSVVLVTAFVTILSAGMASAAERPLAFAVSGVVAEVKVAVGDQVKAGQVLAVLDTRPFEARKRSADAAVKATRIVLDLDVLRLSQIKELFDALSASSEQVDDAKTKRAEAMQANEDAKAEADVTAWELERATLTAPFDGTVSAVPGYAGQVVELTAGVSPVVVVNAP